MKVERISKNIAKFTTNKKHNKIAILSDLHWDNPHCNRDLLKAHLDYCLKEDIKIFINGDFFCLMQGKGDRRGNKSDVRPEHAFNNYFDSIVKTAVDWFTPYAHIIKLIGYGNHETSVLKHQETDIITRFVDLLNYKCNSNILTGGYGGWIWFNYQNSNMVKSLKIKYFHGAGGGGAVTKGAINLSRALSMYEADVYTMGHIHENSARTDAKEIMYLKKGICEVRHKYIHNMITGTYKDEYADGSNGFHIEKGRPIKVLGGRILTLDFDRNRINGVRSLKCAVDSRQFPII
jgi:predicted phosphodiesterase